MEHDRRCERGQIAWWLHRLGQISRRERAGIDSENMVVGVACWCLERRRDEGMKGQDIPLRVRTYNFVKRTRETAAEESMESKVLRRAGGERERVMEEGEKEGEVIWVDFWARRRVR